MAFHDGLNSECLMLMQLCFVLFEHKYSVINGKQVVNVLVNKREKKQKTKPNRVYHVSLPCKTIKAKFKRQELPPFLTMLAVYTRERSFQ